MGDCAYTIINNYGCLFSQEESSILEIGSDRGEGSTRFFNDYSIKNNVRFTTVDLIKTPYVKGLDSNSLATYHIQDGSDFLTHFSKGPKYKFTFVYLDNFDWIWDYLYNEDGTLKYWVQSQVELYKKVLGVNMNNINSTVEHLCQTRILVENGLLSPSALILYDDTFIDSSNIYSGKGGASIHYLLSLGNWKIVHVGNMSVGILRS